MKNSSENPLIKLKVNRNNRPSTIDVAEQHGDIELRKQLTDGLTDRYATSIKGHRPNADANQNLTNPLITGVQEPLSQNLHEAYEIYWQIGISISLFSGNSDCILKVIVDNRACSRIRSRMQAATVMRYYE